MKNPTDVKDKRGINSLSNLLALSFFAFSSGELSAAVSCPDGQYENGSGSCSISSGYTPSDQGSIAQEHLNQYYQNKPKFADYKRQYDEWNDKNLQLIQQLNKPLIRQYQLLAIRLAKWHREDTKSFVEYFKYVKTTAPINLATDIPDDITGDNKRTIMMRFVEDAFVEDTYSYLAAQYNANLKTVAQVYFQMNPTIMKSISINYWIKAYAPSVSGKAGFTSAYADSMVLRDARTLYPFLRLTDSKNYDFKQNEESFFDTWNTANTSPSTRTSKTTKYYKYEPYLLPKSFVANMVRGLDKKLIDEVNKETLARTQSEVVGFHFNNLVNSYLTTNKDKNEQLKKSANLAFAFPKIEDITQMTRVVNQAKKTCLVPNESRAAVGQIDLEHGVDTKNCSSGTRSMDWYVIENDDRTLQLKNAFSGQCLTAPRIGNTGPLTLACGGRANTYPPASQAWQWTGDNRLRPSGMHALNGLTVMAPHDTFTTLRTGRKLDIYPYDYLQGKDADRAEWSIHTGYMRSAMFNPENYKTAELLAQNFFALMYGFTEELPVMDRIKTVNAGKNLPTEHVASNRLSDEYTSEARAVRFFSQIYSNSNLYNQLPDSLQRFITELRSGKPLLEAYSHYAPAIYDDVRNVYTFKPTYWNDPSNKIGSLQIVENDKGNSVDIFVSRFNGNPATSNNPLPTNKTSNDNWTYVASMGSKTQIKKAVNKIRDYFSESGTEAHYGDIFSTLNPISRRREFFQARFAGANPLGEADYPSNQTSNDKWHYLGQQDSATVLIAALTNDMNKAYLTYMYSLIKLNIGTKQKIPAIEQANTPVEETPVDGLDFDNFFHTGQGVPNPVNDSAGPPQMQEFYVSKPTITGLTLYTANNMGALSAITDALLSMKPDALPLINGDPSQLRLERALMRNKFDEMLNARYNDILRARDIAPIDGLQDELRMEDVPVDPSDVFQEWSAGRMNPPPNFQAFRAQFRALFQDGYWGDMEFDEFLDSQIEDLTLDAPAAQGLLALDNSLLSSAFEALTVTTSTIAISTVSVSTVMSTILGITF